MPINCPFCKNESILKQGLRKNKVGKKQKYQCKNCKKWFVERDGFERMRYKPKIISRAIHMHNDGMSLFDVTTHLWQYDGVKVTRMTINNWVKKYSVFLKSPKETGKTKTERETAW